MTFYIDDGQGGSGQKFSTKEDFLHELSMMIARTTEVRTLM